MTDEARRTVSVWLSRGRDRVSDLRMRLELYGGEDLISTISSNANTNAITAAGRMGQSNYPTSRKTT